MQKNENGFKYVKENAPGRECFKNHKKLSANFKQKVMGIESHQNPKIKISWEFKVAKCFKDGEIFLN